MADTTSIQAYALAQTIVQAKEAYMAATSNAARDQAHAAANAARDKLRSLGLGDVADAAGAEDSISQAQGVLPLILKVFGVGTSALPAAGAPTAGGNPNQVQDLNLFGGSASGGARAGVPKSESAQAALGPVGSVVTRWMNSAVGGVDSGIQGGANGVGAAAGGLGQTAFSLLAPLAKLAFPLLLVWAGMKVFKISLGGRGRR
jgi:hypothetical protein